MATNFDPEEFMQRLAEAAARIEKEADPLVQAEKKMAEEAEKNAKALGTFGKSMGSATVQFGKAMTTASEGASKYAGSLESAGSAVKAVTAGFGPLVKGVGIVVDLFSKLAGGVLKQNEALVKSYRSLSQVGDVGRSFQTIMDNMQDAGFSVNQSAEAYTSAINKAAPGLAVFAGSVSDGVDALHENYNVLKLSEKQMQRYGMGQEEMFDRTATFMGILAMSGNKEKRSKEELGAVTQSYLTNLSELSMLTGESRDSLEQKMQKDANDLRYQMMLEGQTDDAKLAMNAVMMDLPEDLREGAKSILVNQGRVVDEQGVAFFQALGHKGIAAMMTATEAKSGEVAGAVGRMQQVHAGILESQFKNFRSVINTSNEGMKDFGLTASTRAYMLRGQAFDEEKFQTRLDSLRDNAANKDMDENTARLQKERRMRNSFEQFEFQMSKFILPMLDSFLTAMEALGEAMADFAHTFSMGRIDVRDAFKTFKSLSDVSSTLTKEQEKQVKINEKLELNRKSNEANEKFIAEQEALKNAGKDYNKSGLEKGYKYRAEHKTEIGALEGQLAQSNRMVSKARTHGNQMAGDKVSGEYKLPENFEKREFSAQQLADIVRFTGGTGDEAHFRKMDSAAANAFVDMASEYYNLFGEKLQINSSHRDEEEQKNVNSGGRPKAAPGKSLHQKGLALDLNSDQVQSLLASGLLGKYGFNPLRDDPPHIQYAQPKAKNGGIFSGPVSGYNVELHGDEMVTPVNKGVTKQPLSSQSNLGSNETLTTYLMAMVEKLENLVELQSQTNRTSEEHLQYAKSN